MILLMDNQINQDSQINPQGLSNIQPGFFSRNKIIIIIIVILGVLSFGATGYLLINNKSSSSEPLPTENVVSVPIVTTSTSKTDSITPQPPTPTATPVLSLEDETASWSAFVSSKYSYSLKYPPNWTAQITNQPDPKILEYVVFNPTATKAGTLSITLSYWARSYAESLALDPQKGQALIVASVSATKKNSKDSNGYKATNVIMPFGSNSIVFNAKEAFETLFNQMLTTLKLLK